jgi:hypothetical protein
MSVQLRRAAALLLAGLALMMLAAGAAFAMSSAAPAPISDFTAAVPDMPGKTWLDLLRQLFPDVVAASASGIAATATKMTPLRSIGSADDDWVRCGDRIEFRTLDVRPVRLADRSYRIVTVAIPDDCAAPLALFDDTGKLVDAVNVKGDQHVSFSGSYIRELGPSGALVIVSNWHDNTSRSYDGTMLILARAEGLSSIGDVLALGSRDCAQGTSMAEETRVRVAQGDAPFARIDVVVTRSVQKLAEDCKTGRGQPVIATFTGSWSWDAGKSAYEPRTKELDRIGSWNRKHF